MLDKFKSWYSDTEQVWQEPDPLPTNTHQTSKKKVYSEKGENKGKISLDNITFGMPPNQHEHATNSKIMETMPTAEILPCEQKMSGGPFLYMLDHDAGWKKYKQILESVGYTRSDSDGRSLKLAYIADSFPTDTFTNEYGQSILERATGAVSSNVGHVAQMMGINEVGDVKKMYNKAAKKGGELFGPIESAMNMAGDWTGKGIKGMENMFEQGSSADNLVEQGIKAGQSAITGRRMDFPLFWNNSTFTPSYTMTVRLYNPNPRNEVSTQKWIAGGVASILALALPINEKGVSAYKWPLLCKVRSPGIYQLDTAFISNVSVIKGGDQQQIGYNQTLGMVDVRIEFGSLYNSIMCGPGSNDYSSKRPTLQNYLAAIGGQNASDIHYKKSKKFLPEDDKDYTNTFGVPPVPKPVPKLVTVKKPESRIRSSVRSLVGALKSVMPN